MRRNCCVTPAPSYSFCVTLTVIRRGALCCVMGWVKAIKGLDAMSQPNVAFTIFFCRREITLYCFFVMPQHYYKFVSRNHRVRRAGAHNASVSSLPLVSPVAHSTQLRDYASTHARMVDPPPLLNVDSCWRERLLPAPSPSLTEVSWALVVEHSRLVRAWRKMLLY